MTDPSARRDQRPTRRWAFRGLAVFLGLLPFLIAEGGLRLAGKGNAQHVADPFVGFSEVRPLFVEDHASGRYVTSPARMPFFRSDGFAAKKGVSEFRIFCLGGSTVQGNPYSIETSFTTWLELNLQAADPSREWQVVNCGGISYASYRLAPILRECLDYQPDLFILYVGDNEFLEDRSYAHTKHAHWLMRGHAWLAHSRLYNVAWSWFRQPEEFGGPRDARTSGSTLAAEVDTLLDYEGGLAQYQRDDSWHQGVEDHFRFALDRMVRDARSAGVDVLLVDPVCNVKDCPPFKVAWDSRVTATQRSKCQAMFEAALDPEEADDTAIDRLRTVLATDPRHAGAWFLLGQRLIQAGRFAEARQALLRAKDEDICPLRITESLRKVIYEVGRLARVPVVPVMKQFEDATECGIPGDELLLDHVHPSITGHQMIAELLLESMKQHGHVQPRAGWSSLAKASHRLHFQTLDTPYFARGKEHLEGLRKWTEGRVTKKRERRVISPP